MKIEDSIFLGYFFNKNKAIEYGFKENSDKFEWIPFNDVAFYEFISKYLDLITCAEDLERTMLHLKVNDKIGPSCVDVSIGYGHLH